jgi:hypothetical protein
MEISKVFRVVDPDGSGSITLPELEGFMKYNQVHACSPFVSASVLWLNRSSWHVSICSILAEQPREGQN